MVEKKEKMKSEDFVFHDNINPHDNEKEGAENNKGKGIPGRETL